MILSTRIGRCKPVLFLAGFALAALASLFPFSAPLAFAQEHDHSMHDHEGHQGLSAAAKPSDPAAEAMDRALQLAYKKESEANHHIAGILVILAGVFVLLEPVLRHRWPFLRFIWPMCFLFGGLFLLIFSDTELWPFGPQSWWYGLTHNLEDLQHKTFAVILLGLAYIEVQRARGVLKAAWAAWVFPLLAAFGSALLLFHEHHSGMGGDHMAHMAIMQRIQSEHLSFSVTGFFIGLTKGLSELRFRWQSLFAGLWPLAMIVLGVLLMLYTE